MSTPNFEMSPVWCWNVPSLELVYAQARLRDEPKMKPNPLSTWQVSVPTLVVTAACAGDCAASVPTIKVAAATGRRDILSMLMVSLWFRLIGARGMSLPCDDDTQTGAPRSPSEFKLCQRYFP